jgi:hypothetical protein
LFAISAGLLLENFAKVLSLGWKFAQKTSKMNSKTFRQFFFVAVIAMNSAIGDQSDDECGVNSDSDDIPGKNLSSSVSQASGSRVRKYPQRSLLIVFDGTSSMGNDLEQMRTAAKQIINELSGRENKPIKNYVLTVFKDPSKIKILDSSSQSAIVLSFQQLSRLSTLKSRRSFTRLSITSN